MVALEVAFTMMAAAWACTQESKVTCSRARKVYFRKYNGSKCANKTAAKLNVSCLCHRIGSTPVMSCAVSKEAGRTSAQASHCQSRHWS